MEASMFSSSEKMSPLTMPFECIRYPEAQTNIALSDQGCYDVKLLFLRQGELKARLKERDFSVTEGNVLVIPPFVDYELDFDSESGNPQFLFVRLDVNQLWEPAYTDGIRAIICCAWSQRMPMVSGERQKETQKLFTLAEKCFEENDNRQIGWETAIKSYLTQLCVSLTRSWIMAGLKRPKNLTPNDPIYSITGYIYHNVQNGLKVEELADRCGLSYPWFAKKFREIYGISCKEYIEQVRVARVEQYLCFTDWDLAQISQITGYSDCSHMIKNFKRLMNKTPGQYRAMKNQQDSQEE